MVVWLKPTSNCGIAVGTSTCQKCWRRVQPLISPASLIVSGTRSSPSIRVAHHRRRRIDRAGDQPDHRSKAEQQQQRDEIGESRHGLHQVERTEQHRTHARTGEPRTPSTKPSTVDIGTASSTRASVFMLCGQ